MAKKTSLHRAEQYAEDVRSGKQIACHWVRQAVERYYKDLDNAIEKGWYFDRQAAERAINFVERLKHVVGRWGGTYIVLEPWQCFILWNIFGWKMSATNTRRFTDAYVEVARKNGKSTLASAIALYMEFADREVGAEVYSVATTRDQARICFDYAQKMVRASDLKNYAVLTRDAIAFERLGATYKPLSSEANTLDGKNSHCVIVDEYHAHPSDAVVDVMHTSFGARAQGLMFIITTAGLSTSVPCFAYRKTLCQVLDGALEADRTFVIVYTLDDLAEVDDPQMWVKANPCVGASLSHEWLQGEYEKMKREPNKIAPTMTKSFNVWMDAPTVWIPDRAWSEMESVVPEDDLLGCSCVGALDLAAVNDYCAFMLLFHERGRYQMLWRFYIPEEKYRNRYELQRENANIEQWVKEGYIVVTDGNVTDYDYIMADIERLGQMYDITTIAYDPWNSSVVATKLVEKGINMQMFTQTIGNFAPPTKEFERIVGLGIVDHYDNPVARWMLSNVVIREDVNGNRRPDKAKSSEKIDGIVAAIMALGQWMSDNAVQESVYASRGIVGDDGEDDNYNDDNDDDYGWDDDE